MSSSSDTAVPSPARLDEAEILEFEHHLAQLVDAQTEACGEPVELLYENRCAARMATRRSAFVALAFHQPRLRVLRPYTSQLDAVLQPYAAVAAQQGPSDVRPG